MVDNEVVGNVGVEGFSKYFAMWNSGLENLLTWV